MNQSRKVTQRFDVEKQQNVKDAFQYRLSVGSDISGFHFDVNIWLSAEDLKRIINGSVRVLNEELEGFTALSVLDVRIIQERQK